jgi:hypothetical protein
MDDTTIDAGASRRRDRNVQRVVELLERRAELRGVHPMADHLAESLGWMV